jgi:O-acetyl-ADP-ribose deacetylase (regulator of RNase III)
MQFRVLVGDITKWKADAIVNSANSTLLGVSGLDSAVHRTGGVSLTAACRSLHGCAEGEAKITYGYHLPARFVIHTVAPLWIGGNRGEDAVLASCYKNSLVLANERHLRHIAFMPLATMEKRYPPARAAAVAVPVLLEEGNSLERIDIICADKASQEAYTRATVFFWLQHLAAADKQGVNEILDEAMAALTLLQMPENEPDPIALSEGIRQMKGFLRPFIDMSKPRNSIIDMEKAAAQIMAAYAEA